MVIAVMSQFGFSPEALLPGVQVKSALPPTGKSPEEAAKIGSAIAAGGFVKD
jgi:hypothetical protein